jgi:hypothetical protein
LGFGPLRATPDGQPLVLNGDTLLQPTNTTPRRVMYWHSTTLIGMLWVAILYYANVLWNVCRAIGPMAMRSERASYLSPPQQRLHHRLPSGRPLYDALRHPTARSAHRLARTVCQHVIPPLCTQTTVVRK